MEVRFVLSVEEKRLFGVLEQVLKHFELNTVLRVAGGWVRDKLMGRDSHDIDIALSDMTGAQFAPKVNEYLSMIGQKVHTIGVISSNPEQSKHLETATVKIFDTWVDFVNLRSETYTQHSRIPETIGIGTPLEDALRRDLTINALFYNINTSTVEDYTQRGLEDLKNKSIATPLPPLQTFMDDPLRVLRALRFASLLTGFVVAADLLQAAGDPQVLGALSKKIARERIGKELDGMLLATRPELAIHWINRLKLFPIVFAVPELPSLLQVNINVETTACEASNLVRQVIRASRSISSKWTHEERRLAVLAATVLPFNGMTYLTPKKRTQTVVSYILLESVKKTKEDSDYVDLLLQGVQEFEVLLKPTEPVPEGEPGIANVPLQDCRVVVGRLLRKLGPIWPISLILACLDHLPAFTHDINEEEIDPSLPEDSHILQTYLNIKIQIEGMGFGDVWDMRPVFSGDDLMLMCDLEPGRGVGIALEREIDWMLANPNITTEELKAYVLAPEFKSYVLEHAPSRRSAKKAAGNKK